MKKFSLIALFILVLGVSHLCAQTTTTAGSSSLVPNTVWSLSLTDYIHKVDTYPPSITGGCVSLTSGTMGASLLLMALNVSLENQKDSIKKKSIVILIANLKIKRDILEALADTDNHIFQSFRAAYKLPHHTPEEIKIKDSVIHNLLRRATESPLAAAQFIERMLAMNKASAKLSAVNVFSDVKAATILMNASFDAIISIADDNIGQLDIADRPAFQKRRNAIVTKEKLMFKSIMTIKRPS